MTLVPFAQPSGALVSQEATVSAYLEQCRDWLATCMEMTGPEQIAAAKAEIATAAEATKQLNLSREIQLDAQEMVRRAEYALAKAIRKGQEDGTVAKLGDGRGERSVLGTNLASPSDFASDVELYDRPSQRKAGILSIADNATPEQFDAALAEAKAEGNLSRANVSRKVKPARPEDESDSVAHADGSKLPREQRAAQIRPLAERGYLSSQIGQEIGISEEQVRKIARECDIPIPGDVAYGKRRRIKATAVFDRTLDQLDMTADVAINTFNDLDISTVVASFDRDETLERLDSLITSLNALSKAVKKIKESFQ